MTDPTQHRRALIVEDEPDLARVMEYNLQAAGFTVRVAATLREGSRFVQSFKPDVILLDLMLPDGSGTELCRTLKSNPNTRAIPIIMVTAKTDEVDRIVGLELGADDYVSKPFSVRELVLRVRNVVRRGESDAPAASVFEFGLLRIDRDAHRVFVNGVETSLTSLEYRLLTTLIDRRNRVQSRETLLSDVWGIYLAVETRTVDTHVKRLREKLGAAGGYVLTVRGAGYRFANDPREVE